MRKSTTSRRKIVNVAWGQIKYEGVRTSAPLDGNSSRLPFDACPPNSNVARVRSPLALRSRVSVRSVGRDAKALQQFFAGPRIAQRRRLEIVPMRGQTPFEELAEYLAECSERFFGVARPRFVRQSRERLAPRFGPYIDAHQKRLAHKAATTTSRNARWLLDSSRNSSGNVTALLEGKRFENSSGLGVNKQAKCFAARFNRGDARRLACRSHAIWPRFDEDFESAQHFLKRRKRKAYGFTPYAAHHH